MSTKRISLFVVALGFVSICFARIERWPVTQKPSLTLARAEAIGDKTIGEKYKDYFCISARFAQLGETDQEWELSYTNTRGEWKYVVIDGKGGANLHEHKRDL